MTTAIVYASKHGSTADIAHRIASQIGDAQVFDLADGAPDLTGFDTVALGTAIYASQPMRSMKDFCRAVSPAGKRVGLFASGMERDEAKRGEELAGAFPEELRSAAVATAFLPGRFQFSKMTPAERFIIKRIAKTSQDVDATDDAAIAAFAEALRPRHPQDGRRGK
jgi:menaquinone-dependent protoporphyrinogen oxidase